MADRGQVERLLHELRHEGIADARVLCAIREIPRDLFVPVECRPHAYRNIPLPIGSGQTISQPLIVAVMTQALRLTGHEKVLEIGTGSGYQCAVLAQLAGRVISIERLAPLAASARRRLDMLGYRNVEIIVGDGSLGCPDEAPFDAIMVTAASPRVPEPLLAQLAEHGCLVMPLGSLESQELVLFHKVAGKITRTQLGPVRFVPLIGRDGWAERDVQMAGNEGEGYAGVG